MNKIILEKALKQIAARKRDAESLAEENLKKAFECEEFKILEKETRSMKVEIAKLEYLEKDATEKKKLFEKKEAEKKQILEKKFGNNFCVAPKYSCAKCNDSGFINGQPCECLREEISKALLSLSGTCKNLSSFENADFSVFEEKNRKTIETIYHKMKEWCDKISITKFKNIGFFGSTGVGKTFLTEAMASYLMKKGEIVVFTSAFSLGQIFLQYHTSLVKDKNLLLDEYINCDVLFLDDLGTEPILKNVTLEYLYLVINERINNGKATVFSTNLSIEDFRNRYGERISSRLLSKRDSLTLNFDFSDLRLKK